MFFTLKSMQTDDIGVDYLRSFYLGAIVQFSNIYL